VLPRHVDIGQLFFYLVFHVESDEYGNHFLAPPSCLGILHFPG
jgi:hypothetical protein